VPAFPTELRPETRDLNCICPGRSIDFAFLIPTRPPLVSGTGLARLESRETPNRKASRVNPRRTATLSAALRVPTVCQRSHAVCARGVRALNQDLIGLERKMPVSKMHGKPAQFAMPRKGVSSFRETGKIVVIERRGLR
jgi:hypothetical protein